MSFLKVRKRINSPVNALLYDLLREKQIDIGGQVISMGSTSFPQPTANVDHILWRFPEPVRVSTPGPDSRLSEIRQYRDRIEFEVWPWASVVIEVVE